MSSLTITAASFVCMSVSPVVIDVVNTTTIVGKCPVVVYMVTPQAPQVRSVNFFAARRLFKAMHKPKGIQPPFELEKVSASEVAPTKVPEVAMDTDQSAAIERGIKFGPTSTIKPNVSHETSRPKRKVTPVSRLTTIERPSDIALRASMKVKKQIPCRKGRSRNNQRQRCERY